MNNTNVNEINIKFEGPGEYGVHDGFFNAIAVIDGKEYDFQCCADNHIIDFDDCGFDWGISRDANNALAKVIGWDNILILLKKAYDQYMTGHIVVTQGIMDIIEAEPMNTEGTHVGYDEDTKEDEVVWNDVYIETPKGTIQCDFTWYGDNSPNSEDGGRWVYSVNTGDRVALVE